MDKDNKKPTNLNVKDLEVQLEHFKPIIID